MKPDPGSIELVSPKILVFIGLPSSIIFFLIFHSSSLELKKREKGREEEEEKERKGERQKGMEGKREEELAPAAMSLLRVFWGETQMPINSPNF